MAWRPKTVVGLHLKLRAGAFEATVPGSLLPRHINRTGALILELCNGRHTVDEIISIVMHSYRMSIAPESEVKYFLTQAVQAGMLEADGLDPH